MEENNNDEKTIIDKAKEIMKKETKKLVSKGIKKILPTILPYIGIFLLILLAIGAVNAIPLIIQEKFKSVLDIFKSADQDSALSTAAQESVIYIDDNGAYKLKAEDFADQLLEELEKQKLNTELVGFKEDDAEEDTEASEDMIEKYIKAEVETTYPKTNCWGNDVDGTIIIKRRTIDGEIKNLDYAKYDTFLGYVRSNPSKALTHFSLNPDTFELCIARNGSSTEYFDENDVSIDIEGEGMIIEEIDYQKYIKNYSVPLNFFITLHLISQDVDFMQDVLDLVTGKGKDEPIVLTYVDSYYKSETELQYTGNDTTNFSGPDANPGSGQQVYMTEEDFEALRASTPANKEINNSNVEDYIGEIEYFKSVYTVYSGKLDVTKADTWITTSAKEIIEGNSSITCRENSKNIKDYDKESTTYHVKETDNAGNAADAAYAETSVWVETGHVKIDEKTLLTNTNRKFIAVDKNSKIDVEKFVKLIQSYPKVENNFKTAPSNIFYLLQQTENTQILEKIMRYVMYILNDINYGVTEEDLEKLFFESFIDTIDVVGNLANYLLAFSHEWGYEAPQSEDGKYYKMFADIEGLPTIGDADLQWKLHEGSFSVPGKIMHNGEKKEVENVAEYINTNCLTRGSSENYSYEEIDAMEIYIEKQLVDLIRDKKQQELYDYVLNQTTGLDLTRQQIYPLVAISYKLGRLPEINGRTFRKAYLEASAQFEESSWKHNRYVWDTWWYAIGGENAYDVFSVDAQFETYVKGIFDFSLSEAGTPLARKYYIYYTSGQIGNFAHAVNNPITRNPNNEESEKEMFTTVKREGTFTSSNEKYICGYWTSTTGRTFTILCQHKIGYENREHWQLNDPPDGPGWAGRCNRAACAIIASGYSNQTPDELITTMNANYDVEIPSNKYWSLYGLTRSKYVSGHVGANRFVEIIREQLQKGGYVAVWVNSKEKGYWGKSTERWTGNIHWMAIIDYKIEKGEEKIAIADARGCAWYDIDEYIHGIDEYALINEE